MANKNRPTVSIVETTKVTQMKKHEAEELFINIKKIGDVSDMTVQEISNLLCTGNYGAIRHQLIKNNINFKRRKSHGSGPARKTKQELFMSTLNSIYGFTFPVESQQEFIKQIKIYPEKWGITLKDSDIAKILDVSLKTVESWRLSTDSKSFRVMDERYKRLLLFEIVFRKQRMVSALNMRKRYTKQI